MAELILHIGTPKTGSTYLQATLRHNVDKLREQGWSYPEFAERANHRILAMAFDSEITAAHRAIGLDEADSLKRAKRLWSDGLRENVHRDSKWIISSEYFGRRITSPEGVQSVVTFLRAHFEKITVIAYVRRQEYILPSIYSQDVKAAWEVNWSWEYCRARFATIDYRELFELWSRAEGIDEVKFVPFIEASKSDARQILRQFTEVTGLKIGPDWTEPPTRKANPSLSVEGIAFLLAINPQIPRISGRGEETKRFRGHVIREIMRVTPGPTFNPADDIIERIRDHFNASNTALVERLPPESGWREWLDQPSHSGRPQQLIPRLSAARTAELMIALSEPSGPIAWGQPDKQPVNPPGLRDLMKQRFKQKLTRSGGA